MERTFRVRVGVGVGEGSFELKVPSQTPLYVDKTEKSSIMSPKSASNSIVVM